MAALTVTVKIRWEVLRRGSTAVVPAHEIELPRAGPIGVIGINGAGKSTLLMAIAGSLAPGVCLLDGVEAVNQVCRYVPQGFPLPGWLTGAELTEAHGLDPQDLRASLPGFHIEEFLQRKVRHLSPGQAQALAVALALKAEGGVLVLDEPFSALDMRRRAALRVYLRSLPRTELVFLSSQVGADLLEVCSCFIILRSGRVAFSGTLDELLATSPGFSRSPDDFEHAVIAHLV